MNIEPPEEIEEYKETEEERRMRDERFIEKFFTERELIVKFDDTSDSDEKNAQAWYKAVEQTMNTLPIYQHDNVGQPLNNSSMSQNGEQSKTDSSAWFFRGQKDSSFAFTSTLYRRLFNTGSDELFSMTALQHEQTMVHAELSLLNKARELGIGRGLTALETLTLLQHHGSPTRLIDVTSDWKVALFFACESDDNKDGRVFLINIDPDGWIHFPKAKSINERTDCLIWQNISETVHKKHIPDILFMWLIRTWPILLPFSDPRMISQRGFFLVGGVPSPLLSINLLTSRCHRCRKNRCECPDRTAKLRSTTLTKRREHSFSSLLETKELRKVTSLPITFCVDKVFLDEILPTADSPWNADGYTIRVPKKYKHTLRLILRREGLHTDSIYPPLRETVRLFEHVVDESLK